MAEPVWRFFTSRQIRAAVAFAQAGGIAIHDNPFGRAWAKGGDAAHMFGPDRTTLFGAAMELGCRESWLQRRSELIDGLTASRLHFDLKGAALRKALARCELDKQT